MNLILEGWRFFWIVILFFLFEVELRGNVIIQDLCANHWHFPITLHFYFNWLFHVVDQGGVKIIIYSQEIFYQYQKYPPVFLLLPIRQNFNCFILILLLFLGNAQFIIECIKTFIQFLTSNSLSFAMSMRKTSISMPISIPEEPESPAQKPNAKAFQRWLYKNQFQHETPVIIEDSFRNLEKPLEFIKDQKIRRLQAQSEYMIETIHNQKQSIAEMSKATYKKVISRDRVDYQFGSSALQDKTWSRGHYQDPHKTEAKKKDDNKKILQKRAELTKQFIHNQHQYDIEQRNQKRELTLQIIKEIDSKDFEQKYKDVEFYQVFLRDDYQKHISNFSDISENQEMDELLNKIRFTLIDRDSYYSPKSSQYLFKAQEQLDFWRRYSNETQEINNADQIQIMKRCQNFNPKQPSYMQLLDFASGKLDSQILSSYFQLKSKQEAEIKINENDENLEEEYNKKKQQYDFLRSMKMKDKTQKIAIKYNKNTTQTNDQLEDQSFDSYFQESVKSLLIRLQDLNRIRDSVMENKQTEPTKKTMLVNIGHEIKNILFRLLAFTLQGESFVNYEEIVDTADQSAAEKKMLQIIYHQFHKVKHLEVDGIPKTKILDTYLEEREKNEKMFELLGRTYAPEKPAPQKPKRSKSPVPQKGKPQKK